MASSGTVDFGMRFARTSFTTPLVVSWIAFPEHIIRKDEMVFVHQECAGPVCADSFATNVSCGINL